VFMSEGQKCTEMVRRPLLVGKDYSSPVDSVFDPDQQEWSNHVSDITAPIRTFPGHYEQVYPFPIPLTLMLFLSIISPSSHSQFLLSQTDKVTFCTVVPPGTVQTFPANRLHRGVGPTHAKKKRYLFFFYTWPKGMWSPEADLQLNPWVAEHLLLAHHQKLTIEQAVYFHLWDVARSKRKGKMVHWSIWSYFEDEMLKPFMDQVKALLVKHKFITK
jgi:hypothetical protein